MLLGEGMDSEHQNKTAMKEGKGHPTPRNNKKKTKRTNMVFITMTLGRPLVLSQMQSLHGKGKRLDSMSFKGFFISDGLFHDRRRTKLL